jgi:hypothetical protein
MVDFMIVSAGTICIRGTTADAIEIREGAHAGAETPDRLAGSEACGSFLEKAASWRKIFRGHGWPQMAS